MGYNDGTGTRLEAAKTGAATVVDALAPGSSASLVLASEGQLDSEAVVSRLLDGRQALPEAIVCYSPADAAVVEKMAALRGKRVPDDLELVTFRGVYRGPQCLCVTAAVLPGEEMGRQAVKMLLQKMEEPALPIRTKTLRCTFEMGATTREL